MLSDFLCANIYASLEMVRLIIKSSTATNGNWGKFRSKEVHTAVMIFLVSMMEQNMVARVCAYCARCSSVCASIVLSIEYIRWFIVFILD
jgi:ferredoxin